MEQIPPQLRKFAYDLATKQVEECLSFIDAAFEFLKKHEFTPASDLPADFFDGYDNTLFDVISGLFQFNKMISLYQLSGSFVRGMLETLIYSWFIYSIIDFGIRVTRFIERILNEGTKMPLFRMSYIKVFWRDVSLIFQTLLNAKFVPSDKELPKFLIEFESDYLDQLAQEPGFNALNLEQKK